MKRFWCRICETWFDATEVENAVDLGGSGRQVYRLYRFPDQSVHDLRAKIVPDLPPPALEETTPSPVSEPQPEIIASPDSGNAQEVKAPVKLVGNGARDLAEQLRRAWANQKEPDWQKDSDSQEEFR